MPFKSWFSPGQGIACHSQPNKPRLRVNEARLAKLGFGRIWAWLAMSATAYLKADCDYCSGHIEYPVELGGLSIECPHCRQTTALPVLALPPASVPPLASPGSPRHVRRHSIFYYVFWSTVSLFATLAILFLAFIFLTAAGAGFLGALIGRTPNSEAKVPTPAVRNLPPLTEEERQVAIRIMGNLRVKHDNIEGITWYSPDAADGYETAVYVYLGKNEKGKPWLRWMIRYYGDDWLFIRKYRIRVDDEDAKTLLPTKQIKHDNSRGSVWEIFDEPASEHANLLNQILASKTTYLRMEGTDRVKDIELRSDDLQQMRNVLLVYRYLGGVWPAN